ncbi:MAG: hypothetical protein ACTHOB_14570 [Ginsengibacter sp.]
MRPTFIFAIAILFASACTAQNDLLILKKHNRTIQSFYPGSEIDFSTSTREYEASISSITKDSLFLVQYDVRRVYTNLGVFVLDTVAEYHFAVNYHDILSLEKPRKNFDWSSSGAALFGGGAILTTAGLITWIFAKPNTRYYARPSLVISAAALATAGYFLMKTGNRTWKIGTKYKLQYIKMK